MSKKKLYRKLVRRYLQNKASTEELEVFFDLLEKGKLQPYFQKLLQTYAKKETQAPVFVLNRWRHLTGAAILTGILSLGSLWYYHYTTAVSIRTVQTRPKPDKAPGWDHALLTLSTGRIVDLDSNSAPLLQLQQNARLVRNKSGEWSYHSKAGDSASITYGDSASITYNTLSAPGGRQFSFLLEDGTRVWLNAASSLRFPVKFSRNSREVALTGEAYFEVAPDAHAPFLVDAGNTRITVLGTHFNVNAYADESAITTTLLEGSVRISRDQTHDQTHDQTRDRTTILLHPGEQAILRPNGTVNTVSDQELTDAAVAWKNGYFSFEEDDIRSVMRQISRWYNVDVRYEGPVTKAVFGGNMGRDLSLMQVLKLLGKSQVHFRLDNNTLTVLPG
jgi:transmembrane sensor